jgi:hypothetical protein
MPGTPSLDRPTFKEGFTNEMLIEGPSASNKMIIDIIGTTERTESTKPNPFMNVLVNEISDYPAKPPAKYILSSQMKPIIDKQFENKVYADPRREVQKKKKGSKWQLENGRNLY